MLINSQDQASSASKYAWIIIRPLIASLVSIVIGVGCAVVFPLIEEKLRRGCGQQSFIINVPANSGNNINAETDNFELEGQQGAIILNEVNLDESETHADILITDDNPDNDNETDTNKHNLTANKAENTTPPFICDYNTILISISCAFSVFANIFWMLIWCLISTFLTGLAGIFLTSVVSMLNIFRIQLFARGLHG